VPRHGRPDRGHQGFCYGRSTTALMAQFLAQNLLYTVSVTLPAGSASIAPAQVASEQDLVTRIVSNMN
jgi:hypothetical protein